MRNRKLTSQVYMIQNLIKQTLQSCDDIEMQSHWAKYLCVLSSGLFEIAVQEIYGDFVRENTSQPIAKFVESKLARITNPNMKVFLELSDAFNVSWRSELQEFIDEDGRSEAINSIISNRHLISHGRAKDSSITVTQLQNWFEKSLEVIKFIDKQCSR